MGPGWHAPQHLRIDALRLPSQNLDLRPVDTVLFLLEHGRLSESLSNILTCAAVCRAISVGRGTLPSIKVMTEAELLNSSQGFTDNLFLRDVSKGSHALLLTGVTLYNRQLEGLLGAYARRGATLEAITALVDDEVPLGQKDDPQIFILDQVFRTLSEYDDGLVQSLTRDALSVKNQHAGEQLKRVAESIDTLLVMALPWFRRTGEAAPRVPEVVSRMIAEWATGARIPSDVVPLIERHAEAREIAESIWHGATEIAHGVFELIGIPHAEMDEVVRNALRDLYRADPRARLVVEKNPDRPANALRYDEALAFERRLSVGESAEDLLAEVEEILQRRKDSGTLLTLALGRDRDRDPKDMLEQITQPARYIPDPSGFCYTVLKSPPEDALYEELQRVGVPLVTHHSLWLCDMRNGKARPSPLIFQAKDLQRFVGITDSL